MLEEWQYSAEILIAHFRCVLRGQVPFSQGHEAAHQSFARADLDNEAIAYVQEVSAIMKTRSRLTPVLESAAIADVIVFA